MSTKWNKPYTVRSLRAAMHHGAVDRKRNRWLVLRGTDVVEGHDWLHSAAGAATILNDHDAERGLPRDYKFCILEAGLCQEVDQGLWRDE